MKNLKVILFYVVVIGLIIFIATSLLGKPDAEAVTYNEVENYFEKDLVKEFGVSNSGKLVMEVYIVGENGELDIAEDGTVKSKTKTVGYQLSGLSLYKFDRNVDTYTQNENLAKYDFEPEATLPWWVSFLPYIIIFVVIIALWFYVMNQAAGGKGSKMNSFGKARVKMPSANDKDRITFRDVAGEDEEKAELEEIVAYLKDPAKFSRLGAKIPHGVLLVGPPGTGKTLLAKAVAGEAGVPFFSISGSDFVEMYVGVGASRVRDLFENARKAPASIIFIDEIDAVGRHRGSGLGGGHDEREQTLNQLLVEMDGFGSHDGIIVIAATNRPDILDPALLRPGRFDRQITVNYPDIKGREEILRVHARNKPLGGDVDLAKVAQTTAGFTGADLANLLNEAALLAARRNKSLIDNDDIEDSFIKVIAGPKKRSMIKEKEKRNTAYHEAGHAVLHHLLPHLDPVHQISIIPSGRALGYTMAPPSEDKYSESRDELCEDICSLLGGRAAEEIVFGDFTGGASDDIRRATKTARKMVAQLGMSELLGPVNYTSEQNEIFIGRSFGETKNFSESIASKIDAEVERIIREARDLAKRLLTENRAKLDFIAEFLVKNEVMDGDQFRAVMEGEPTMEEVEQIAVDKKNKRKQADEERARLNEEKKKREAREAEEAETAREQDNEVPH